MRLLTAVAIPIGAIAVSWGAAAVWFDGPGVPGVRGTLAFAYVAISIGLCLGLSRRTRALSVAGVFALVLAWWLTLAPSNERDWLPDVAEPCDDLGLEPLS